MKQDLKSMTLAEMQEAFVALGEPKFRAKQVFKIGRASCRERG